MKYLVKFFTKIVAFLMHPFFIKSLYFIIANINTNYIIKQLKICGKNPTILFLITSYDLKYISIGDNFNACSRLRIEAIDKHLDNKYIPELTIGNNVSINYDCHIGCVNKVLIGNNVLMASRIFIKDHFHGETILDSFLLPPNNRKVMSKRQVIIEDNVWIG